MLDVTVVERVIESRVLCVVLHTELSFERHVRSIAASASSKVGIMRKDSCLFGDPVLGLRSFLVLPASCVRVLLSCLDV